MITSAFETSAPRTPSNPWGREGRFLQANDAAYRKAAGRIAESNWRRNPDATLAQLELAARSATRFHSGRFADGLLENILLEMGRELSTERGDLLDDRSCLPTSTKRRILHVVSAVLGIGGHTRTIQHWIEHDSASCHSVLLMGQGHLPIPAWLGSTVTTRGGALLALPAHFSLRAKAARLRAIAAKADLVVLHHGGWDVVPSLAFAVGDGPPVVVLNHADHEFWLGSSIADLVINLRSAAVAHTRERRFIDRNTVLPIPLGPRSAVCDKAEARRRLGIPVSQTVLLSIARAEKFWPHGNYDFVGTARRILQRIPGAHLYMVGESVDGLRCYFRGALPDRLHLLGVIENPSIWRAAADVFLETFPFGSQTSVLEAAQSGVPIVPSYAPLFPLLVANDDSLVDLLANPDSEEAYIAKVEGLIRDPAERERLAEELSERIQRDHVGEGWIHRLSPVYAATDHLGHRPHRIPATTCQSSPADVGLSHWRIMADGRSTAPVDSGDIDSALLAHRAYVARETHEYVESVRHAGSVLRKGPLTSAAWRLLLVNALGQSATPLRNKYKWLVSTISNRVSE